MPSRNITSGLNTPYSIFATSNGDVFIDNGNSNSRVDKWTLSVRYFQKKTYNHHVQHIIK